MTSKNKNNGNGKSNGNNNGNGNGNNKGNGKRLVASAAPSLRPSAERWPLRGGD